VIYEAHSWLILPEFRWNAKHYKYALIYAVMLTVLQQGSIEIRSDSNGGED